MCRLLKWTERQRWEWTDRPAPDWRRICWAGCEWICSDRWWTSDCHCQWHLGEKWDQRQRKQYIVLLWIFDGLGWDYRTMHSVPQIRSCPFLRDTFDIVIRVRACLQFDSSRETKCRSLRTMCVERCVPHSFAMIRFSSHKPIENGVFNFFFESNTRLFRHICAVLWSNMHVVVDPSTIATRKMSCVYSLFSLTKHQQRIAIYLFFLLLFVFGFFLLFSSLYIAIAAVIPFDWITWGHNSLRCFNQELFNKDLFPNLSYGLAL